MSDCGLRIADSTAAGELRGLAFLAMAETELDLPRRRARLKRTLTALAVLLIVMGAFVLLVARRMPLPMRLFIGLADVFAGFVLLLIIRPKFDA